MFISKLCTQLSDKSIANLIILLSYFGNKWMSGIQQSLFDHASMSAYVDFEYI